MRRTFHRAATWFAVVLAVVIVLPAPVLAGTGPRAREAPAPVTALPDLTRYFTGFDGTFVLFQVSSGRTLRHNPAQAAELLAPNSTFKIPHALIALDTGVADGPDFPLPWDGRARWRESWNRDHTLASAIEVSAVWYFQEIARRIGSECMKNGLARIGYGNEDISGGLDRFWIQSSLKISADDQVLFLRRLMAEVLPFRPEHQRMVKDMMIVRRGETGTLRGKTGTGADAAGTTAVIGWFVGALEVPGDRFVFAANLKGRGATGVRAQQIAETVLADLGVLE